MHRPRGVAGAVAAVVAAVAVYGIVAHFAGRNDGPEAAKLSAIASATRPPGLAVMGGSEHGGSDGLCIGSCPHPEVVIIFRTRLSPDEACRRLAVAVSTAAGLIGPQPHGCDASLALPNVNSAARATITAGTVSEMRASAAPAWRDAIQLTDDANYAVVDLIGGPT